MNDQQTPDDMTRTPTTTPTDVALVPSVSTPHPSPTSRPRGTSSGGRRLLFINGLGLLAVLALGGGLFALWHQGYYFYSSDDARVDGAMTTAAPPAGGSIIRVYHALGSAVRAGDTIATLRSASGRPVPVISPLSGTIVDEGATPGEVIGAGQTLAQVVDPSTAYITAYVEETHIKDVHPGQSVDVTLDAIGDTTFHGAVTRILPVAASDLSALPSSDYASGNFTKTTQRVPVQITLDGFQGKTLYPGTSARVTIHIHD